MNREQIQKEYEELIHEYRREADKIIEKAKAEGNWRPGLDTNKELFRELKRQHDKKVEKLKESLSE